jgi:hypothetical protein
MEAGHWTAIVFNPILGFLSGVEDLGDNTPRARSRIISYNGIRGDPPVSLARPISYLGAHSKPEIRIRGRRVSSCFCSKGLPEIIYGWTRSLGFRAGWGLGLEPHPKSDNSSSSS